MSTNTRADSNGPRTYFYDALISRAIGTSPWQLYPALESLCDIGTSFSFEDEFTSLSTGANTRWQVVKGTGGALALSSSGLITGGWINIPTAASASNDYQLLATQQPIFLPTAGNPLCYEFAVSVTEANTNTASWAVGLSSTLTTGFLSNAGAPPSSYSGAVFWKATGGLTLAFQTANGTTKNTIANVNSVVSGTTYIVGAAVMTVNSTDTVCTVYPYVSQVVNNAMSIVTLGAPQNWTIASLAQMYLFAAIRTASANAETLSLDYARCLAVR